jgi:phenylacetate-coenzyme A ligase PaaK-like adenylate-forming protein
VGSAGPRAAKIGSPSPWHLSAQLGATLSDPRRPTLRLPASAPIDELADAVDRFRPDVLTAYPSVLSALAGRLAVAPAQVCSGGEPLTDAVRRRIVDAWGVEPFDQYVTTEAGTIASECPAHAGMHVLDDHVVLEPDAAGVLVTVLSSRTLPLLRYRLDDRVTTTDEPCPCGRSSTRIVAIEGKARELLPLGGAAVHPTVLTQVLDTAPVGAWQVTHSPARVVVRVVTPGASFDAAALARSLADVLPPAVAVDVEVVDRLPAAASGKASLFVSDAAAR